MKALRLYLGIHKGEKMLGINAIIEDIDGESIQFLEKCIKPMNIENMIITTIVQLSRKYSSVKSLGVYTDNETALEFLNNVVGGKVDFPYRYKYNAIRLQRLMENGLRIVVVSVPKSETFGTVQCNAKNLIEKYEKRICNVR